MTSDKGGYGHADMHQSRAPLQQRKTRPKALRVVLMSVAPAHRTRDNDRNFGPDIEAELGQVMLLPDAIAHAPHE